MFDIYEAITNRIIDALEAGTIPWRKPWKGGCRYAISHTTGKPYSLLNQLLLGERPGEYLTWKQIHDEGGRVKKGAEAQFVVFWKMIDKTEEDEDGDMLTRQIPFLRYFNVFHIDDCEGIKPKYAAETFDPANTPDPIANAEAVFADYIRRSGVTFCQDYQDRAFYRPADDSIHLPLLEQFQDASEYYSTLFHETVHSTGHATRLNRLENGGGFGSEVYSKEELTAEIGAATILAALGIETESSFANSAAYIENWLTVLKNDKRLIVSAAGRAEKAVRLILNEQPAEKPANEPKPAKKQPAPVELPDTVDSLDAFAALLGTSAA